jgi:hypothetical protein
MVAVLHEDVGRDPYKPLFEFMSMLFGAGAEVDCVAPLIRRLAEQPALVLAIEAWDAESNLVEDAPQADGLLGTAAIEATRLARALTRVLYPGDRKGEQK